ncbi:MAG: hypothetical protein KBT34_09990 [Prevotella sp.]|nr:hypothetical protein [Candidatus Prevotella equi]
MMNGKLMITFEIDAVSTEEINDLNGIELDVIAHKHREKRSLDANAYFHVLVGKIADKRNLSKQYVKNMLICSYGQQLLNLDGAPVVFKANVQPEEMFENMTLHCAPCRSSIENGKEIVFYKVFRGSHTYDTHEMHVLISGTVDEAKQQGIEVLPPRELERMVNAWHEA